MIHALLVASFIFGGLSLLGFGAFLVAGSFELVPLGLDQGPALALDAVLSLLFFMQHSGMVRGAFRRRLAKALPDQYHSALYSATSGMVLLLLLVFWQRSETVIWSVTGPAAWLVRGVFLAGVLGFWWGVKALRSFDVLGVAPILDELRQRERPPMPFTVRGPYRFVRHPLYTFSLVLIWASPHCTLDRLVFAVLWTGWIVLGTVLEERDLVVAFGDRYRTYQRDVPMLVPWRRSGAIASSPTR